MSIESVLARIGELQGAFTPPAQPPAQSTATATAASPSNFAGMLQSAMGPGALGTSSPLAPIAGSSDIGSRIVAAAAGEVGQTEQPPGSNNSPRIAEYRQATAGNPGPGPWCAYFASWAARQAGAPIGDNGAGSGSVDALYAWAQRTGRAESVSSGYTPKPGDLIVWNEHIGIVENVLPDGSIQTIEGNSSDSVARRTHPRGDAIGYIRTG